jgi:hypothetical protein
MNHDSNVCATCGYVLPNHNNECKENWFEIKHSVDGKEVYDAAIRFNTGFYKIMVGSRRDNLVSIYHAKKV